MNTLLIIQIVILAVLLGMLALGFVLIRSVYRSAINTVRDFVTAPDENTQSPLSQTVESAGHVAGRAIALEIKTMIMGRNSGESRAEQAALTSIAEDEAAKSSPLLAGALSLFGKRGKNALLKNPALMGFVTQKLASMGNNQSSGHSSNGDHPRFKL